MTASDLLERLSLPEEAEGVMLEGGRVSEDFKEYLSIEGYYYVRNDWKEPAFYKESDLETHLAQRLRKQSAEIPIPQDHFKRIKTMYDNSECYLLRVSHKPNAHHIIKDNFDRYVVLKTNKKSDERKGGLR